MNDHERKVELFNRYCARLETVSGAARACDITDKQWKHAIKKFAAGADRETVIGFLDTSLTTSGKSGYLFTDEKVYYLEVLERPKKLWYDEVDSIAVKNKQKSKDSDRSLRFQMKDGTFVEWTSTLLNKTPLCELLQELVKLENPRYTSSAPSIEHSTSRKPGAEAAGFGVGNYGNVNRLFDEEKFHAQQGHGFAAERANDLFDKMTGHDAKILGDDNAKYGADRIVDGVYIQSKYCATGADCIRNCFEGNGSGSFKYMIDGKPMQIEVPSNEKIYNDAVRAMENKIENGQVPGVTDKKEAQNLVRKGHFTYEQARNIAKAGTVESITYDAVNGAVVATSAFGVTAVLTFATSIWNGEDFEVSLKNATYSGLKVGGTAFITSILASQLSKAGLNSALVGSSEAIVRLMGPKASAVLINAFRTGAKPIYGAAAMKSAAKLLRGNVITAGVTVLVLSSVDITNIFRRRISGKQLVKNLVNTTGTVVGGTGGWIAGAAAGSAILPVGGTIVGGLVGSLVGGGGAGKLTGKVTDAIIQDDADKMVKILQKEFEVLAEEYLLNHKEAEKCVDRLSEKLSGKVLKDMFASKDRPAFARSLMVPIVEKRVAQREVIALPSKEAMIGSLREVLEEIADAESSDSATIN